MCLSLGAVEPAVLFSCHLLAPCWVLSECPSLLGQLQAQPEQGVGPSPWDSSERRKSAGPQLRSEWPKLAGDLDGFIPMFPVAS